MSAMKLLLGDYRSHRVVVMAPKCLSCYMQIVCRMLLLPA